MPKRKDTEPVDEPVMHTGTDTPEGQRDLAVNTQIALDAGQIPGGPVIYDDRGQPIEREVTDNVSGQDL